jgi:hypothetical protein
VKGRSEKFDSIETREGASRSSSAASAQVDPKQRSLPVIGIVEYVDMPLWKIAGLRAKVDTGARTSALHVENLREIGANRVRFDVRLHRKKLHRRITVDAPIARRARVRPSSGVSQMRIFVSTLVKIGEHSRVVELSLVDRGNMIFRMLLGRSVLENQFLVDAGTRYRLGRRRKPRPEARST